MNLRGTRLSLVVLVAAIVLIVIALLHMREHRATALRHAEVQLQSITRLRAEHLRAWISERESDARHFGDPLTAAALRQVIAGAEDEQAAATRAELESFRRRHDLEALVLSDAGGRDVLALGGSPPTTVDGTAATGTPMLRPTTGGGLVFETRTAIPDGDEGGGATLLLREDAIDVLGHILDPGALPWESSRLALRVAPPADGRARAAVVRLEADGARLEVTDGAPGAARPRLASVSPVPGSPFAVAASVERREVLAGLLDNDVVVIGAAFLVVLLAGLVATALWRRELGQAQLAALVAERHQERLAARYRELAEHANDIILLLDGDGRILEANARAEEAYGVPRHELAGRGGWTLRAEPDEADMRHQLALAAERGSRYETVHRRGDGSSFPVEVSVRRHDVDGQPLFLAILRDVSERRRLEERLRQGEKLEALGQLAAGVAHDFNNVLQVILSAGEEARRMAERGVAAPQQLEAVVGAADHGAVLTRRLLAFGRGQPRESVVLDINELAEGLLKILRRLIGPAVRLDFEPCPHPCTVRGDGGELEQVLLNLCLNARDAMPDGGTITIGLSAGDLPGELRAAPPVDRGVRWIRVTVRDTGSGMDEATRRRIFEPFFTTKEPGRGTGLGLATVYGIVARHGGLLDVVTAPGAGTAIHVWLPMVEERRPAVAAEPVEVARGGGEVLLVAEDDPAVREAVVGLLEIAGYTVVAAADGAAALEAFELEPERFDAAILDVVMPRMGGRELHARLVERRPDLPVLYTSGYSPGTDDSFLADAPGPYRVLVKPYRTAELLRVLRKLLDGVYSDGHPTLTT